MTHTYSKYWNMSRHPSAPMACEHIAAYYAHLVGVVRRKGSRTIIRK